VIEVRPVESTRDLRAWCALTERIYSDAPGFIPPIRQQLRDFHSGTSPYLDREDIVFLSVLRDGELVGRTTAHRHRKLDERMGMRHLLFGYTEFVDDPAVFAAIADELTLRARGAGAARMLGPVNLLPNQSGGVVTSGFDERGFVDAAYSRPYYAPTYERHGFERMFAGATAIARGLQHDPRPPEEVFAFDDERIEHEQLQIRHANRRRIDEELEVVRTMLNASFALRAYYTPIDADELAYQVDGLGYLIDERIALYLYKDGRPVAFMLCIPDISEFVRRVGGNLNLVNQLRLLATRSRYRSEAICVIKGTVPEEQGKGYMSLLSRELLRNLRAAGYETLRGTYIETHNVASSAQADEMGGGPLHEVTFYARDVT
jgi:GNAT superfamily N-acetyltransferase